METLIIKDKSQLLDLIGASNPNPNAEGPAVVMAKIWDGRIVIASYKTKTEGEFMVGDAETYDDVFYDLMPLTPFVDKMLSDGESFFTVTGTDDLVCSLEWSIHNN